MTAKAAGQVPSALKITPVTRQISLQPGDTYAGDTAGPFAIRVTNPSAQAVEVSAVVKPYSVTDKTYQTFSYSRSTAFNQIASWISFSQTDYTIQPGEVAEIPFSVTVPDDAPAGGRPEVRSRRKRGVPARRHRRVLPVRCR